MAEPTIYSIAGVYEPFSSLSHLLSAVAVLVLGVLLLRSGWGMARRVATLAVFVLSAVFLLSMSGVYHLLPAGAARDVMQRLDHAGIFALIAGTFTPVHAMAFQGFGRWGAVAGIWLIAATAITVKTVFFTSIPEWASLILYLGFGWLGLASGLALWRRFGYRFIRPLVWGALAYTLGAVVDFTRSVTLWPGVIGPHELFHVLVVVGLAAHTAFIWKLTHRDRRQSPRPAATSAPSPGYPAGPGRSAASGR